MPNWKKVITSGSNASLNQITASADISSSGTIFADKLHLESGKNIQWVNSSTFIQGTDSSLSIDSDNILNFYADTRFIFHDANVGIGIGNNNPSNALHIVDGSGTDLTPALKLQKEVDGDGSATGILLGAVNAGQSKGGIFFENKGISSGRGSLHFASNNTSDTSEATIADARMTIIDGGNVGIGTTEPVNTLQVAGVISSSGDIVTEGDITASGNITASNINVSDDIFVGRRLEHFGDTNTYIEFTNDDIDIRAGGVANLTCTSTAVAVNYLNGTVDFRVDGDTNDNVFFVDGGTEKVGIGTGTPGEALTVMGNISSSLTGSFGKMTIGTPTMAHQNTQLTIVGGKNGNDIARFTRDTAHGASAEPYVGINANSADPQIRFYEGSDQAAIGQDATNSNLVFATGSKINKKEAMVIDTDGKVGIGTTSPDEVLEVVGNISASATSTGSFGTLNLEGTNFSSASLASAIAGGGGGSGDITGVDLSGGSGISIGSETGTESGDYSATISVDSTTISGSSTTLSSSLAGRVTTNEQKLDGIEASADVTDTSNVTSAGALMDSELSEIGTVKSLTKASISGSSTALSSSLAGRVTTNETKLDGIENNADVTDTSNVTSAGALMDSELSEIATIKSLTKASISGSFGNQRVGTDDDVAFNSISASGDITASGFNLVGSGTAELEVDGHITASGNISASGQLIAGSADFPGNITTAGILDITNTTDSSNDSGDTGALRVEGGASIAKKLYVGTDLDVDGTTNLDAVNISATTQIDADVTLTEDGVGADFKVFGQESGKYLQWENGENKLNVSGEISSSGFFVSHSGAVSVNSDHTGSFEAPPGKFSINYGNGTELTGSLVANGLGYGDIVKLGNTTTLTGRIYCFTSQSTWDLATLTGAVSSSLLGVALGTNSNVDGMLLRGFVQGVAQNAAVPGQAFYTNGASRFSMEAPSTSGNVVRIMGYALGDGVNNPHYYFNPDHTYVVIA